jgi:hypothetical protein
MANLEHVEVVKQGTTAVRAWKEKHPNGVLDLSDHRFTEPLNLEGADLECAKLEGSKLHGAHLAKATLESIAATGVELTGATLTGANLQSATLERAVLTKCDLQGANMLGANAKGATLTEAILSGANLKGVCLDEVDVDGADFTKSDLTGTSMTDIRNLVRARGLETVRIRDGLDPKNLRDYTPPWHAHYVGWDRIRVVGRLPLFAFSYVGVFSTIAFVYLLDWYNKIIQKLRDWATQFEGATDYEPVALLEKYLILREIPSLTRIFLASSVLLAIASTVYSIACPTRIQEFSKDQWVDQLKNRLIHYWPLTWSRPFRRWFTLICYTVGGIGALWVIGSKVVATFCIIWRYS